MPDDTQTQTTGPLPETATPEVANENPTPSPASESAGATAAEEKHVPHGLICALVVEAEADAEKGWAWLRAELAKL